jgi:hypothetical protein
LEGAFYENECSKFFHCTLVLMADLLLIGGTFCPQTAAEVPQVPYPHSSRRPSTMHKARV